MLAEHDRGVKPDSFPDLPPGQAVGVRDGDGGGELAGVLPLGIGEGCEAASVLGVVQSRTIPSALQSARAASSWPWRHSQAPMVSAALRVLSRARTRHGRGG